MDHYKLSPDDATSVRLRVNAGKYDASTNPNGPFIYYQEQDVQKDQVLNNSYELEELLAPLCDSEFASSRSHRSLLSYALPRPTK